MMRFMADSRPADGVLPEQVRQYFDDNGVSSHAWEMVRHHVVTDYAFKVGETPGVVLFVSADSEADVRQLVDSLPVVAQGLLRFELEPIGTFMHL